MKIRVNRYELFFFINVTHFIMQLCFIESTYTAIGSFFFIREHFNLNKVAQITKKKKANGHSVYLLFVNNTSFTYLKIVTYLTCFNWQFLYMYTRSNTWKTNYNIVLQRKRSSFVIVTVYYQAHAIVDIGLNRNRILSYRKFHVIN